MFRLGTITDELSPNVERALKMASQLGVIDVEIHTAWNTNVEELTDAQVDWLKEALAAFRLRVPVISSTIFLRCSLLDSSEAVPRLPGFRAIGGGYADHLRALGRVFEVARILEAHILRIFGFWREGPTTEEVEQLAAERLGPALELAREAGVVLALETCPHSYFDWGIRAARLVQRINSPWLRLLWDPAGAYRAGEPDYLAPYPTLRPYLAHVHVKDMVVNPCLPRGRAYVPVGQGEINWKEIMTRLVRDGYDGVLSLETHHMGPDGRRESAAKASFAGLARLYRAVSATAQTEQAKPEKAVNND